MKTIWKFPLTKSDIEMPLGAQIISCQLQGGCPTIWAMVCPETGEKETRHFFNVMTGGEIPPNSVFLGTCVQPYGIVMHIYEKLK